MRDRDLRYRGREQLRRASFIAPELAAPDLKHQDLFLPSPSGSSTKPTLSDAIRPVSARPGTLSKPKAAPEAAPRATPVGTGAAPKKRSRAERTLARETYVHGLEVGGQIRWLTLDQLADHLGVSSRTLRLQSVKEKWAKLRDRVQAEAALELHRKKLKTLVKNKERFDEGAMAVIMRLLDETMRKLVEADQIRKKPEAEGGNPDYALPEKTVAELSSTMLKLINSITRLLGLPDMVTATSDPPGVVLGRAARGEDEATLALAAKLEQMDPEQAVRYVEAVFGPSPAGNRKN